MLDIKDKIWNTVKNLLVSLMSDIGIKTLNSSLCQIYSLDNSFIVSLIFSHNSSQNNMSESSGSEKKKHWMVSSLAGSIMISLNIIDWSQLFNIFLQSALVFY